MCVSVLVCVCSHFVSLEHSKHLKLKAKGHLLGVSKKFNGCFKDVLRVFQEDSWCMALIAVTRSEGVFFVVLAVFL